jgi:FkbM family methyltransferase
MEYADIHNKPIVEIGGCGFGCVLVHKKVLAEVGYPQFEYHPALNHDNTISEDTDFCKKARDKNFTLWCDPSILCGHIGSTTMHVQPPVVDPVQARLRSIHDQRMLPKEHVDYLFSMANSGINPKVIYDIGACVMHWTNEARQVWPDANVVMFDAMNHAEFLYKESGLPYYCEGPLGDSERWVKFYEDALNPAGSSIFKEDTPFFTEEHAVNKKMRTLDDIVKANSWPKPNLIKIDVQGAEQLILNGAQETLSECSDIIIELQHEEYNLGAPKVAEVTEYLNSLGFVLINNIIKTDVDGDYHFKRV